MAAPLESSLSTLCKEIATFLENSIKVTDVDVKVLIGNPKDAEDAAKKEKSKINLFFYRFESSGGFPDNLPTEMSYLKAYCLVTPFTVSTDEISAGELDLRLLGDVMRIFHETPEQIVDIEYEKERTGEEDPEEYSFHIQTIYQGINTEEINQIWSTQGEVVYRPSALYEIALAPIIPKQQTLGSPRVAAISADVSANSEAGNKDWAPEITLVDDGEAVNALEFVANSDDVNDFEANLWLVGSEENDDDEWEVIWSVWDESSGWTEEDAVLPNDDLTISGDTISDDAASDASTSVVNLPFTDRAGQAELRVIRKYKRHEDGAQQEQKSNPILITLTEA